ncbi:MAG: putative cardiolipin synthase YwiE [bacterium ADurb.Bin374]|nr:MAG: putative cardiolipin synthase YwiE [bacterium ADurb.Bin374]
MKCFNTSVVRGIALAFLAVIIVTTWLGAGSPTLAPNDDLKAAFDSIDVPKGDINTRVRYIWRNDDALYARWKMLESAKETIDCTYFIVDKDIFGQAFLGLLAKKAREGVRIRLMIDGRIYRSGYMKGMPDRFEELAAVPNVQIKQFNSVGKSLLAMFEDFRAAFASNHDKIIIVDGKTSIIGGRNIGPDYFVGKGEYDIVYRDSDVLMSGTHVAAQLKKAFDDEWGCLRNSVVKPDTFNWKDQSARLDLANMALRRFMLGQGLYDESKIKLSGKLPEALKEFNEELSKYKNLSSYASFQLFRGERPKPVKILDKHSRLGALNGITPTLVKFIDSCKSEIIIQNPYLVLTAEAEAALKRASDRGVKIIMHTNSGGSTDSLFPQAFLMSDWKKMLRDMPTCRLLVAPSINERLHSKVFVFDRQIAVVGSYNMDALSEQINSEVVAAICDPQFATMTALRLFDDMKSTVEYKITVDKDGNVTKAYGPEDHCSKEIVKKMNFLRKLTWLRPVI